VLSVVRGGADFRAGTTPRLQERPTHVLFVDNEPIVLALCRDIAHDLGMIVDTVATTEDALDFMTREVIDLVVTDIRVPEIGGMGLIKLLRSQHPEVGVVVVSAHGTIESAVESTPFGSYRLHYEAIFG
jgi:DNA-binding NtrC family response regulator